MALHSHISAVIPCFNAEQTIARALTSVIQQTAAVKEIIVVDDASCDRTLEVVEETKHESRIPVKVYRLESNSGPARARNVGWQLASGDYVAFLDSDDTWHPSKIFIHAAYIASNEAAVFSGHRRDVYCHKDPLALTSLERRIEAKFTPISWRSLLISNPFAMSSVIIRADVPYRFDVDLKVKGCEDYLLWCEITHAGHRGYWTQEALAFTYKEHFGAGGLSGNIAEMGRSQRVMIGKLRDRGMLSRYEYAGVLIWSWCKLMRRYAIVALRR